jgi:hypothetical protein
MRLLFFGTPAPIELLCANPQLSPTQQVQELIHMCVRHVTSPATLSDENGELVDQLVALSGARKADRITVTGRATLDVLLGLCRRGFLHAMCRTPKEP